MTGEQLLATRIFEGLHMTAIGPELSMQQAALKAPASFLSI